MGFTSVSDVTERRQKDSTVKQNTRPRIINNYQANFRGVDICDQLRSKYLVGRSSKKWWKFSVKRKTSRCKFCPKHGEKKRKETIHGCNKCDKHLCSFECHRRFHAVIGVVVMEE
ncbi:uncharacterized protein LOC127728960 [Mytilus californianus]|uniref:uncharacterized protein LOC127728960 n=1 Tax=Mytilus californianus TaxID=6549 RepID=UPI002246E522|nr:uncharacterized protein LOC127728960 [Mytilus californianus]